MQLQAFLSAVKNDQWFSFDEVMNVMLAHYAYQPTEFTNGLGADCLHNAAGSNEGSCKIFAFALINGLSKE
ncbi:MAG: HopJ type III effector protein, partial [Methylovulum sp.]|nr:HopJ type III effector protein [Methylovulum sp.]